VLALSGKQLPLPATLKLTETLRGAILAACPEPIPEWISGHTLDGKPSSDPHLALLPLPFVGHERADGRLMGVALALPGRLEPREATRCLRFLLHNEHGLPRRNKLFAGQWFECVAELETRQAPPFNLRSELWTRQSRIWASVTPVVLDRHFDGKDKWERATETVKDACERIGLPRPKEVLLHPVSLIEGVPHVREFPYLTRKRDGGRMHHSHAVIVFEVDVTGPIMVGAGRFRGYGLCRPMGRD
jgi:CRISPR-associated protein Csb2